MGMFALCDDRYDDSICAIHVMSNLFNDLHFTTSLFLNTIYFCFSIFNDNALSNASFPRFHIKQWL